MNKCRVIEKETWPRKELFDFYQKFDAPCFNISVSIAAQPLYDYAKRRNESFFLLALYAILRAANAVPQIRQRVMDGNIVEFEKIAVMTPIMTEQELFRQIWCEYEPTYAEFVKDAAAKVEAARQNTPSPTTGHGEDFLCASCLPWLHFTSITQAEHHFHQQVPILAWGKMKDGLVPFSCKFSHSFMDGLHASRFFENIETSFTHPDTLYNPASFLESLYF